MATNYDHNALQAEVSFIRHGSVKSVHHVGNLENGDDKYSP